MQTSQPQVIDEVRHILRQKFSGEATGHDFHHLERVWRLALHIHGKEGGNRTVVELAALLHDFADWKFHGGDLAEGPKQVRQLLQELAVDAATVNHVCDIVDSVSFKGAGVKDQTRSLEAAIVQDADRLDAIGAIGVARCFAYGGLKGNPLHEPEIQPHLHQTSQEYIGAKGTSINHFFEKLLLLKDRMHTPTARQLAMERQRTMESFLEAFFTEWRFGQ